MFKPGVTDDLESMGLTREEARLYLLLTGVKSGTVREIMESRLFKQRANVYKVLGSLANKGFVVIEEKEEGRRFFPSSPDAMIMKAIQRQKAILADLEARATSISDAIEQEGRSFIQKIAGDAVRDQEPGNAIGSVGFPAEIKELILRVVPLDWRVREAPYIGKKRGMGTIYSVEFFTHRRFGATDAGITAHEFPYREHRDGALLAAKSYHVAEMERGLSRMDKQGPIQVRSYRLVPDQFKLLKFTRIEIRLNIPGTFSGGIATFTIPRYPRHVFCIWGADVRDFEIIAARLLDQEEGVVGL